MIDELETYEIPESTKSRNAKSLATVLYLKVSDIV